MHHPSPPHAALSIAVFALFTTLIVAILLLGSLRLGLVPAFEGQVSLAPLGTLTIRNGASCRPELPFQACQSGIGREEFRIAYTSGDGQMLLFSTIWSHR
jgi:hypothetical protein